MTDNSWYTLIVGGIVARVGSVVYDASLTRQLEKMRQQLLARA